MALTAVTSSVILGGSGQAVHDLGAFELDGNAVKDTAADDWANVYCTVTGLPAGCTGVTHNPPTVNATATSFVNDGSQNASIFTTGGSKDQQDISSWKWKDQAGGLPDKDNLQDAFAARYTLPETAACPNPAPGTTTCEVLYFGSDRFDNSGDAQQGFWFFQNPISLNANGSFSGVHKVGDLLILSDFSNGGTVSTITIYKWVGSGGSDGTLDFLAGSTVTPAKCGLDPTDQFCGIVNPNNGTTSPWPFVDKSGNSTFLQGELYEGGVNLSNLGLGGECFSSIAAETRSSTSVTATLKDFVLGQFAVCSATLSTQASAGVTEQTSVSPGTSVTDLATVQGSGGNPPPTPTGNITFSLCGPTATDSTALCTSGGTQVGTPKALADASPPAGKATATSDAVNTPGSPLAPGRYCFRADWPGDPVNYPGAQSHAGTNATECFIVRQIPTSTVTTPSNGSGVPLVSPLPLGTTIYDKAVVTGTAIGGTPTGTVNFFLCNPSQVTGNPGAEVCPSNVGAAVGSPTLAAVTGSNPPSASALSNGTAANSAGVWCFRATYVPSGTTYLGSSDASHSECVTVSPAGTTTVTTPRAGGANITQPVPVNTSVTDHAVVTGTSAGGSPTGTVNFFVCNPTQVATNGGTCSTGGTAAGSVSPLTPGAGNTATADSSAVVANVVGTWCFRAEYVSNTANYTNSSDASTGECFVVNDSTSAASQQDWLPNDSAQITSAGGTALNGTLTFTLHLSGDCSGAAAYTKQFTLTGEASGTNHSTDNTTVKVSSSQSASWSVDFVSTDPLVGGSSHCEHTDLTIVN